MSQQHHAAGKNGKPLWENKQVSSVEHMEQCSCLAQLWAPPSQGDVGTTQKPGKQGQEQ